MAYGRYKYSKLASKPMTEEEEIKKKAELQKEFDQLHGEIKDELDKKLSEGPSLEHMKEDVEQLAAHAELFKRIQPEQPEKQEQSASCWSTLFSCLPCCGKSEENEEERKYTLA